MAHHPTIQALFDWLVDGAPGAATPMAVLERFCPDLVEAGVPIDRAQAFVRTLHPSFMGRRFLWERGVKEVKAVEASWALINSPSFQASHVHKVFATGEKVRFRLTPEAELTEDLAGLRSQGFTDWVVFPLKFMSGTTHGITFATRTPGGFTDEHLATIW